MELRPRISRHDRQGRRRRIRRRVRIAGQVQAVAFGAGRPDHVARPVMVALDRRWASGQRFAHHLRLGLDLAGGEHPSPLRPEHETRMDLAARRNRSQISNQRGHVGVAQPREDRRGHRPERRPIGTDTFAKGARDLRIRIDRQGPGQIGGVQDAHRRILDPGISVQLLPMTAVAAEHPGQPLAAFHRVAGEGLELGRHPRRCGCLGIVAYGPAADEVKQAENEDEARIFRHDHPPKGLSISID